MLYKHLFIEELGTGKDKLEPEEVPTVELKDTSRIVYTNSAPEVKYKKMINAVSILGVWNMLLKLLMVSMKNNQCQA